MKKEKTKTQANGILSDLKRGWKVTPMDALRRHGCLRLAPRIFDLRKEGYNITTEIISYKGANFASYKLVNKSA